MRGPMSDAFPSTSYVAPTATVGAGAVIEPAAFVGDGCTLGQRVVVESRASVHCAQGSAAATMIGDDVRIGAGSVVSGPLNVGRGAVIRPGAVVTEHVPAHAIVEGNPGVVIGYTTADQLDVPIVAPPDDPLTTVDVCGATLIRLPEYADLRGSLSVIQSGAGLQFLPERVFFTYGVANRRVRGSHAHRTLHEVLIAVGGDITVVVDDGIRRAQVILDSPALALHVPPMLWLTQYAFSSTATLAVLASDVYDESDYIREYDQYLEALHDG